MSSSETDVEQNQQLDPYAHRKYQRPDKAFETPGKMTTPEKEICFYPLTGQDKGATR